MALNIAEFIKHELSRAPPKCGIEFKANNAWIKCPFHGNGNERTPSLKLNLEGKYVASWLCFGCGKHGGWNDLAPHIGCKKTNGEAAALQAYPLSKNELKNLLGEEDNEINNKNVLESPLFPKNEKWRDINGWLLRRIGARICFDEFGSHVYLPIKMNKRWISGIKCAWSKSRAAYIYESTPDIKSALFPYDYVKKELKALPPRKRVLVLGEGPRDALNPLQNDILTLANLGGITSWHKDKIEAIIELEVKAIILANDPDEIGSRLSKQQYKDLKKYVPNIVRFKLKPENKEKNRKKEDLGNLSAERMLYLKDKVEQLTKVKR